MRSARLRALCALILLFLFVLSACAAGKSTAETPAPEENQPDTLSGVRFGSADVGDELMRALGVDLSDYLAAPLEATLRLDLDEAGRCTLRCDYGSCRETLQQALLAFILELQEQEAGGSLSGLPLAEALGADPNDFAAALCDELLPPPATRAGRLSGDGSAVTWSDGTVSPLRAADGVLWLSLPDWGDVSFQPETR